MPYLLTVDQKQQCTDDSKSCLELFLARCNERNFNSFGMLPEFCLSTTLKEVISPITTLKWPNQFGGKEGDETAQRKKKKVLLHQDNAWSDRSMKIIA